MKLFVLVFLGILSSSLGKVGFGPGDQDWGTETLRQGAHMFWWLYTTTANVTKPSDRPLVIWLQGGPGASSTGYGNFAEIGPLNTDLEPRDYTWVKDVNVLFIDNPVGTGFSYVTGKNFATDNAQIAKDLVSLLKAFYTKRPEFKNVPLYVASESYGGKMTAEFALVLDKETKAKKIESNLKGVILGDAWISPIDSVLSWAPYLRSFGLVDVDGFTAITKAAQKCKRLLEAGKYQAATNQWGYTENVILSVTKNVDFYNVITPVKPLPWKSISKPSSTAEDDQKIDEIIKNVTRTLGLSQKWGAQRGDVFTYLGVDFMKPVTHIVENLLNNTDIKVYVLNGQLDLIVDTPGTVAWVDNLKWKSSDKYHAAKREAIVVNGAIQGYQKKYGNFAMYWVNRAGHMVPSDNPLAMENILSQLTDSYKG